MRKLVYMRWEKVIISTYHPDDWLKKGAVMLSKKEQTRLARADGKAKLQGLLTPDTLVYYLQRRTRSGATRYLHLFVIRDDQLININHAIAAAWGYGRSEKGELVIRGHGFSAIADVIYNVSRILWPDEDVNLSYQSID